MGNNTYKVVGFAAKNVQPDAEVVKWVQSQEGKEAINKMLAEAQKKSSDRYERQQVSYEQLTTPIAI